MSRVRSRLSRVFLLFSSLLAAGGSTAPGGDTEGFRLENGDRVVLVGNTLIERAQRYGYVEMALATTWDADDVTFRNLGWSGDTVFGDARAGFDTPKEGRARLIEQVERAEPTVLFVCYGSNAAFDGISGLVSFVAGYRELLDSWDGLAREVVLLGPLDHGAFRSELPDPAGYNANASVYREAIHELAKERGYRYVDLQAQVEALSELPWIGYSDNGVHLGDEGYRDLAAALVRGLTGSAPTWRLSIDSAGVVDEADGVALVGADGFADRIELRFREGPGTGSAVRSRWLRVRGLPRGQYTLECGSSPRLGAIATAEAWSEGVEFDDAFAAGKGIVIRQQIVAKNRIFFYRWRPQNETYLFGFRKHEQGQNAIEVPQFDQYVEAAETEVAKLLRPVVRVYTLRRTP